MYMPLYIPLYSHIISDDFSVVVASPKVTPLRLVFLRHQRPLEPWHPQISWMGKTRENPIEMDGMYERGTTMDHETSMFVLHKDLNPPFFCGKRNKFKSIRGWWWQRRGIDHASSECDFASDVGASIRGYSWPRRTERAEKDWPGFFLDQDGAWNQNWGVD